MPSYCGIFKGESFFFHISDAFMELAQSSTWRKIFQMKLMLSFTVSKSTLF
jgi:hypothetical protein